MKFGRIVLQVNKLLLQESDLWSEVTLFQDGGHDVISPRKVLLSGCVHMQRLPSTCLIRRGYPLSIIRPVYTVSDP